jgi:alpha-methylacyl-CoA racemase
MTPPRPGPLGDLKVVELAGIGPSQFAGMFLAELGADVVRVDRPVPSDAFTVEPSRDLLNRGKRSVVVDLKDPDGVDLVLRMVARADVLIEGFRPGVAERLGLGPAQCAARNPRLVYGRMTGWGQTGPLAHTAGHDINYISLTGVLDAIGEAGRAPQVPLSVIGDYAGGANYLVIGVLAALRTGTGQVVDAAMVDGTCHLLTAFHALVNDGKWSGRRGDNVVDGGAPFYGVYETSDSQYVAVGAIEPQFYAELLRLLDLPAEAMGAQYDKAAWPDTKARIAGRFSIGSRAHWEARFAGTDACVTPVLDFREAAAHEQVGGRGSVTMEDGALAPGLAPRLAGTGDVAVLPPPRPGQHTDAVRRDWGLD